MSISEPGLAIWGSCRGRDQCAEDGSLWCERVGKEGGGRENGRRTGERGENECDCELEAEADTREGGLSESVRANGRNGCGDGGYGSYGWNGGC